MCNKKEREEVYLTINRKVLTQLRQTKQDCGIPMSRQLELAWLKIHGDKK